MIDLSGTWQLAPDPQNRGREGEWFRAVRPDAKDIPVPGELHMAFPDVFGVFWYWRRFVPEPGAGPHERVLLRFGAVDYLAEVWLNGLAVGGHEGGETPFALDVTEALKPGVENLLAVRVLNPCHERIDGIVLNETPHRNKRIPQPPGSLYNYGGILLPVLLEFAPAIRVTDVFVEPDVATGGVRVQVTVRNDTTEAVRGEISVAVSTQRDNGQIATVTLRAEFATGETLHPVALRIPQPHLWDLDDPFLYRADVDVCAGACHHRVPVRFGFRDFRVVDGWFCLNGKRLFLKSTHTGNHFPVSCTAPVLPEFQRRDLVYAKALGFNGVRFISGVAWPEQLDFCDELGLMVYEECSASWDTIAESPQRGERFDRATREMIRRDRNHPSVTLWGLLNEIKDGPMFRHAVEALALVRDLDPTRLVLLGSGRWDGQWQIGSVANPGGRQWEHAWGAEAPEATPVSGPSSPGGYAVGAGDAHVYPSTPQTAATNAFIRNLGKDSKPVFLSEHGTGSLMNVIDELRKFDEVGASPDLPDAALIRSMAGKLETDWKRWGFDGVYPFAEDMLRDSQRLHGRQRRLGFDLIRSNPQLCGFNLTGILDHAITGEGLWTFWREFKPGIADVLRDGWAPLRWCLFTEPLHGYVGRPLTLEAVLANEDILPSGEYPVHFRVLGPQGIAWEKQTVVRIPPSGPGGRAPLAVPVLKETVTLDGPPGVYEFAARLERGGCPAGDRMKFRLSAAADLPKVRATVSVWGVPDTAVTWLDAHGVRCRPFTESRPRGRDIILVGAPALLSDPEPRTLNPDAFWPALWQRVERGAVAVILNPKALRQGDDTTARLPFANRGICKSFGDWLYHKECVAKRHAVFAGLQAGGILDWDYYDQVISHEMFEGQDTPEEVICAAFTTGYCCPGGYESGVMIGAYRLGAGRLVLNTLHILEELDRHPAADRSLLNLVTYSVGK